MGATDGMSGFVAGGFTVVGGKLLVVGCFGVGVVTLFQRFEK